MTKAEALKKAGYTPKIGRPSIAKEPTAVYAIRLTQTLKLALDKMGPDVVRYKLSNI